MDMLERVALAIFCSGYSPEEVLSGSAASKYGEWPGMSEQSIRQARAAIEAMREPTEGMVEPGALAGEMYGNTDAAATWRAMIDEALKPGV